MKVLIGLLLTICLASSLANSPALILTKLIKENRTEEAREKSVVNPSLFLQRKSNAGFFTVDEKYNSNLFFWFIEAENHRPDTPWIIWLQGGPGVSSLAGLFDEVGPFKVDDHGDTISARKWTWAKDHSLLFIDNPVGAGFSYTDHTPGYVRDMEMCAKNLYSFLRQFLMVFPELREAPLYIAGESYAGRYIPALGVKILEQDSDIGSLDINFKGIILGNPVINRESVADYSAMYYHWGLIDYQGLLAVKPLQDAYTRALEKNDTNEAISLRDNLLDKLDDIAKQQNDYNVLLDRIGHLDTFEKFIEKAGVREALHVGQTTFDFSNGPVHTYLRQDFLGDIRSKVETLLDNGFKVLIYCGQLDLTAPCVPNAQARRKYWQWNGRVDFLNAPRTPWWYNSTVAGYVKSGGGFTEVLIRGAGHLAPMDKPEEITNLITTFIQGLDLPIPPGYRISATDTAKYVESEGYYLISGENVKYGTSPGMVASIVINVLLMLTIICGVLYAMRWKRRHELLTYMEESNMDYSTMI